MHEWALAEGVISTALEVTEKEGWTEIARIVVRIGELQRIEKDVFQMALQAVMPPSEPRLASTRIELEIEPVRFRCRPCERTFGLADATRGLDHDQGEAIHFVPELAHAWLNCPHCDSPDFEVAQGRGVWIASLEGD